MRRMFLVILITLCAGAFVAGYGLRHLLSPSESVRFVNASDHDAVLGYVAQEQGKNAMRSACFQLRPGASATCSLDLGSLPHVTFFASNGSVEYVLEDYLIFPAAPQHLITRQRSAITYTGAEFTRIAGKRESSGVTRKNERIDMNCFSQTNNSEQGR